MSTLFFTGFPGFLGTRLLPGFLAREGRARAVCLVQPAWMDQARARMAALTASQPELDQRIELVEGDITLPDLGVGGAWDDLVGRVTRVIHLAAVYDLAVAPGLAERVNVLGTRHVLEFCRALRSPERLDYVSTCYVSGRYPGVFREDQLEEGQTFNNHYEATKYRAEVEVRRALDGGLPGTIYRPSIVVGDRHTGETQKYDGPYYFIRWVLRQGRVALVPIVGDPDAHTLNVVPRDFVVDAILALSGTSASLGETYQLADRDPPTIREVVEAIGAAAGARLIPVPLPRSLARWSLSHVPGLERFMGIPAASVDYFVHPTSYDTRRATRALEPFGIRPPSLLEYLDRLVAFVRANPDIPSAPMT